MTMSFLGYRRTDGRVGTRNYVGVLATVACANEVALGIANQVRGTMAFTHQQGCCQTPPDLARVTRTLAGLGCNPNLAAVILVSLGCEGTDVASVAAAIAATGKPVEVLAIQESGGLAKTLAKGTLLAQKLVMDASRIERVECPESDLVLGLKCGSSDTTSGLAPNPALGLAVERLTAAGGTAVMGEVTEFIGAEHILAAQAKDEATGRRILDLVERMENRAKAIGVDMRGGQPTPGNIKGGLTTIEEKSLGAIAKAGRAIVQDVYEYGERPSVKGLVVMDSPGREPELLTGMAAAGCNVIVFTTGRGAPQGFPFVPVLKVTGNRNTWETLVDHMDLSVHEVIDGSESMPTAAGRLYDAILGVAGGVTTKAEVSGYFKAMDIYVTGPVI
ncbi:(2R)-sulfolactate sulfo-lyase subunit beta [uncultured Alphaproteobacteria bacterium]|uniref:(2R)-sulfolactate sulfo-lyase subunit beta n=1 Tax=uncultured Alphaproteobacteria bacterium TaxID=91750 RepID=A0A212JS04_9PROT|nr:(2R)-sulfolactate sulfo-lyase subunit beta [uncultured Alphaproteobacteria bacterium]